MRKVIRELKWLVVSALIVASAIGLVISVANLSQHRVDMNVARVDAGEVQTVEYTRWGK